MKFRYIVGCLAITLGFLSCGKSPTAGGTADSGNVKFAGILHTVSGGAAAGATVTLYPFSEGDSSSLDTTAIRRTTTDDSGRFSFDSVKFGEYYIEGNDQTANAVLLKVSVTGEDEWQLFKEDTLRPYAAFKGSVGRSSSLSTERYLTVHGLDRKTTIDHDGNFTFDNLPAGTFRFRIFTVNSTRKPIDTREYSFAPGQTLSVPYLGWLHRSRIYLNTTVTGSNITSTVTGFPVLVRLNSTNFDFGEASATGSDCRFTNNNDIPLSFEVEQWDAAKGIGEIWVKIDTIKGNDNSQYFNMLWGNPTIEPRKAGSAVFDTSDGFAGVWHLSDTTVELVKDATENGYNGTASGMTSTSMIDGIIGDARAFDGVATSIVIDKSADSKLNYPEDGTYSLSAWVYAQTLDSVSHVVVSKGDEQYFICSVKGSSSIPNWQFVEFNDRTGWESCSGSATEGEWVHLTGVRNGESQYLFVNGELVDSTQNLLPSTKSRITDFDVAIGMFQETGTAEGDSYFKGYIDEVRINNVALSADWIKLCYLNQRTDDKLVRFQNQE